MYLMIILLTGCSAWQLVIYFWVFYMQYFAAYRYFKTKLWENVENKIIKNNYYLFLEIYVIHNYSIKNYALKNFNNFNCVFSRLQLFPWHFD